MQDFNQDILCGLDEAGRGPLAGPVCAAAVILPPNFPVEILNDSKALSEKKREAAAVVIKEKALYAISFVDEKEIDRINILNASLLAMKNAFTSLLEKLNNEKLGLSFPQYPSGSENSASKTASGATPNSKLMENPSLIIRAIADGNKVPPLPLEFSGLKIIPECMVKADAKVHEVMAASILAKTARDEFMLKMDELYPEYGYAKHKGYPTPAHKKICRELGPSPIQRLSFSY